MTAADFWRNNSSLIHITPPGGRWAEGVDVLNKLSEWAGDDTVLDFGCGDGRMTPAFRPNKYIGVDINKHAIEKCKELYPTHQFQLIRGALPQRQAVLCYAVLLHIPDEDIADAIFSVVEASERVLVAEIMGRHWRGPGVPGLFQREKEEYQLLFEHFGAHLEHSSSRTYNRYGGTEITFLEFRCGALSNAI